MVKGELTDSGFFLLSGRTRRKIRVGKGGSRLHRLPLNKHLCSACGIHSGLVLDWGVHQRLWLRVEKKATSSPDLRKAGIKLKGILRGWRVLGGSLGLERGKGEGKEKDGKLHGIAWDLWGIEGLQQLSQ
jgi:hypothetical protein